MAVTTIEIVDILWQHIKTNIGGSINGGIYKFERPTDSVKEDIVITALELNNEQLQSVFVNINIHAAPVKVKYGGITNNAPNLKRLNEIAKLLKPFLDEQWMYDYSFRIVNEGLVREGRTGTGTYSELGESFYLIRLAFYSENF